MDVFRPLDSISFNSNFTAEHELIIHRIFTRQDRRSNKEWVVARVLPLPILPPILAASLSRTPNVVSGLVQAYQREEYSADICTDYFCGGELATLSTFGHISSDVLMHLAMESD